MDFTEMATQLPVGVQVLQTHTHTHTLRTGPVLCLPWTDRLDHHAPPSAVIGPDPVLQGHAHIYHISISISIYITTPLSP